MLQTRWADVCQASRSLHQYICVVMLRWSDPEGRRLLAEPSGVIIISILLLRAHIQSYIHGSILPYWHNGSYRNALPYRYDRYYLLRYRSMLPYRHNRCYRNATIALPYTIALLYRYDRYYRIAMGATTLSLWALLLYRIATKTSTISLRLLLIEAVLFGSGTTACTSSRYGSECLLADVGC